MADEQIHIVHISDLQAGKACLAELETQGLEDTKLEERYAHYATELARDVREVFKEVQEPQRVHLLAVTGDITNTCSHREYRQASVFLNTLAKQLDVHYNNVAVLPGNHDVDWVAMRKKWGRRPLNTPQQRKDCAKIKEKMFKFRNWVNQLYKNNGSDHRYRVGYPIAFNHVECDKLVVVGLDSCERCIFERGHNRKKMAGDSNINYGHVSGSQLSNALSYYQDSRPDGIRICLLHHNPFPHSEADAASGLDDPDRLREALAKENISLILAGHMHRARYEILWDPAIRRDQICYTLITGPCCMQLNQRKFALGQYEEIYPNRYQIVSIDLVSRFVTVYLRRFSFERRASGTSPRGAWTSDTDPAYATPWGEYSLPLDPTNQQVWDQFKTVYGIAKGPVGLIDYSQRE